jgi:hypothetical protein
MSESAKIVAWTGLMAGAVLLAAACGGEDAKPEAAASAKPAAAAPTGAAPGGVTPAKTGAPATTGGEAAKPANPAAPADKGAVTAPEQQSYPMIAKTIPDSCSNAHVILANAPASVGVDYEWQWSKQAMIANQQFKAVPNAAMAPGQVSFQVYQADASMAEAYALVASCSDGSTCNRLASMYKAIVKSSNPQVMCGDLPKTFTPKKELDLLPGGAEANLPKAGNAIGMCARIAACTIASKPDTTDDVGINCQKQPGKFKTECASKYPCAEVMSCLGQ